MITHFDEEWGKAKGQADYDEAHWAAMRVAIEELERKVELIDHMLLPGPDGVWRPNNRSAVETVHREYFTPPEESSADWLKANTLGNRQMLGLAEKLTPPPWWLDSPEEEPP